MFNTSFNLGGAPLVETLEDALCCIGQPGLDYIYLPEYGKMITRTYKGCLSLPDPEEKMMVVDTREESAGTSV